MQSKLAAAATGILVLVLVAFGAALLLGALSPSATPNSQVMLNRDPNAVQDSSGSLNPQGITGDQGITGIPRPDGAGQNAAPAPTPAPMPTSVDPGTSGPPAPSRSAAEFSPGSSVPKDWPADVPFPDKVTVGTVDLDKHVDFLLYRKSTVAMTGGELLTALENEKWRVTTVGTPRSATMVARKGPASLTLLVTDRAEGLPTGWVSIRLIYQAEPPPQPEPTPTPTKDPLQGRA